MTLIVTVNQPIKNLHTLKHNEGIDVTQKGQKGHRITPRSRLFHYISAPIMRRWLKYANGNDLKSAFFITTYITYFQQLPVDSITAAQGVGKFLYSLKTKKENVFRHQ